MGTFDLEAGTYAYVGSAMSGLEARTRRHLEGGGRKRWHIDYLMGLAEDKEALLFPSPVDIECDLAARLRSLPGTSEPLAGFGSSDCRCRSHLFRLDLQACSALGQAFSKEKEGAVRPQDPPSLFMVASTSLVGPECICTMNIQIDNAQGRKTHQSGLLKLVSVK